MVDKVKDFDLVRHELISVFAAYLSIVYWSLEYSKLFLSYALYCGTQL